MSDLYQYDGAEVVVLRIPAQTTETKVREIGALFPGWYIWHSDWFDTWDAYRDEPYFRPGAVAGRAFMVSAYNASDLVLQQHFVIWVVVVCRFHAHRR